MNKAKRNGKIEVLRFVFAISVVLYHCQKHYMSINKDTMHFAFFSRGYIGVEFFFLVSGFFMAKAAYKEIGIHGQITDNLGLETFQYTWKKIKAILPWHFTAFSIMFIATAILEHYTFRKIIYALFNMMPNLFLFSKVGFSYGNLNRVEWYISCMVFALMILYPICRKYYSMFIYVIAPVGGMFMLGYLNENFGSVTDVSRWNGIVFTCMIRAIAEIALGAVAFEISRVLKDKKISVVKRKFLSVLEVFGYLFVFAFIMSTVHTKYEIYAVLVMIMAISISLSGQTGDWGLNNQFCYFLGKASLPIYLSQVLPLDFVKEYVISPPLQKSGIMLLLTLLNAGICALIICVLKRGWKRITENSR